MENIAAFFDVDGTIFRNSLLIEHFKLLISYKFISYNAWSIDVEDKFNKWTNRVGNYDEYLYALADKYVEGLKSLNPEDVNFIAKRVIDLKGDNVYRYTKDRIKYHKEMGHKIVIISGSPDFLVGKMAKKLGIDDYFATEYIIEDNKYTGAVVPMWDSVSKNMAIKHYVEKHNVDLSKSYAYGDTTGDFSMFELVGNPIAINPAKRLLNSIIDNEEVAEKIKIVIERKDVMYNLKVNQIEYNREDI